ncbi:TPA: hypothetical protein ACKP7E_002327 [Pseudomonas aeruginosa]
MNKANECTCPSGDGSLVHPCPAHPAVEQAGGDERAAFERAFTVQEGIYFDDKRGEYRSMNLRAIEATDAQDLNLRLQGWQARAALASTPVADESPMAKMADALREKARQEQQAYQDRRNQATQWGPMPEGTEADRPISTAPVAHVAGDETSRYLEWAKDRSAWEMPVGTPVYYAALAQPSPMRCLACGGYHGNSGLPCPNMRVTAQAQPSPAQAEQHWPKLEKPAQVGAIRFSAGVSSRLVVEAAQRLYEFESTPEKEAERPEVAEVAFVLRNIGAMDAEDIDGDNVDLRFEDAEGRDTGCDVSIVEYAEKAADLFEQHDRIVGALRAENAKLSEALDECDGDRWKLRSERDAANARLHEVATACATAEQERDAALARVAELEMQEPVALANRGLHAFWVKWTEAAAGLYGPGIKLYAAPVAQAQQLHDLDKQCRDDVARALGLRPSQERGFAWSYLLTSIKSCVKASEDSAKAQHSVPEGWMLVECGIWTQEQVDEMQKTVTRFRNSEFVDDRALAMAVADAGQCKAPEISLAELLAAAPGKEGV